MTLVDLQAGELLDRLRRQLRAADRVGGVELVGAVAGDLDEQVAREREQRDHALIRVETQQHRRVGALIVGCRFGALVGAEQQDRVRLALLRLRQHDSGISDGSMSSATSVEEDQPGGRRRRRDRGDDHDGGDREPEPEVALRGQLLDLAHARRDRQHLLFADAWVSVLLSQYELPSSCQPTRRSRSPS